MGQQEVSELTTLAAALSGDIVALQSGAALMRGLTTGAAAGTPVDGANAVAETLDGGFSLLGQHLQDLLKVAMKLAE